MTRSRVGATTEGTVSEHQLAALKIAGDDPEGLVFATSVVRKARSGRNIAVGYRTIRALEAQGLIEYHAEMYSDRVAAGPFGRTGDYGYRLRRWVEVWGVITEHGFKVLAAQETT